MGCVYLEAESSQHVPDRSGYRLCRVFLLARTSCDFIQKVPSSTNPTTLELFLMRLGTWKWGVISGLIFAIIISIPQAHVWYARGTEWNGSCAYLDSDELPYAAYTNALIDGRPRRNDPYSGQDDKRFETLFSIQFLPAYVVALPSRLLGLSANTAFIFLLPLAAFSATLVIFWLLLQLTNKVPIAAVGSVLVLSLGSVITHNPLHVLQGIESGYTAFPFLRRYIPAVPFPLFLAMIVFTWRALTRHVGWAVMAGFGLIGLVFSYFFLWTATAAWLAAILLLWFIARPQDRTRVWKSAVIITGMAVPALIVYTKLLSNRISTNDRGLLLEFTHTPDLFRGPEIYAALVVLLLLYRIRKGVSSPRDPKMILVASLAVATFIVFNQQVITGRSLQPFHYEEFVANYWMSLALLLCLTTFPQQLSKRILVYLGIGGFGIALLLAVQVSKATLASNSQFDEVRAVALKLRDNNLKGTVFAPNFRLTNSIAATARNPVLWSRYFYTFSDVDNEQQKKRYFQHIYFAGYDSERLMYLLHNDYFARWEVFGADRVNPALSRNFRDITEDEIAGAIHEYQSFVESFSLDLARSPLLSYATVSPNSDLTNLDRWYARDEGIKAGSFIIYQLRLKDTAVNTVRTPNR